MKKMIGTTIITTTTAAAAPGAGDTAGSDLVERVGQGFSAPR